MATFHTRYNKLNAAQREAVDTIDGPLLVVAGPGTGKTELLSMRVANILHKTDTLPENILCLTFTDSGATAMRARLANIIGPDAYKVAIQTFHSFGTETINHNSEYFYHGAAFKPADDLTMHAFMMQIFDELHYDNPLASKMNGEYTHLRDAMQVISELKQAGLTDNELLQIIASNDETLNAVEANVASIFANKISKTTITLIAPIAKVAAELPLPKLPPAITPLANNLALSLAHAFDAAVESDKTTPITAWRNAWMEKDSTGAFVFKDRKRHAKLRAMAPVYNRYRELMQKAALYDYDDMILSVVQAIERSSELKFNLQERYHYILVDEFQDTNLAQLRILFNLTDNPTGDAPNIMAVGDDDQAIYSFQGADVGNIHRFRERYPNYRHVVLTENYRSAQTILDDARAVITQASGRLETTMEINKHLTSHAAESKTVELHEHTAPADERAWIAKHIAEQIAHGTRPSDIAVISRRHRDLVELLPYLHERGIAVNYERRDNVLDDERIVAIELLARTVTAIAGGQHNEADSLLPELVSHPMYDFSPETIWKLSVNAYRNQTSWINTMLATPALAPFAAWLLERARAAAHESVEEFIDELIGVPNGKKRQFTSPLYDHYFGADVLAKNPEAYLEALEALRTIRSKLRDYRGDHLTIADFVDFIDDYRQLDTPITSVRRRSDTIDDAINLMTAHKSKGLEFDTVYVINSIDAQWGERVRGRSRTISYPENITIAPNADTYDERLRLYFVAMTRAKRQLFLTYSRTDLNGKDTLVASFLTGVNLQPIVHRTPETVAQLTAQAQTAWHDRIIRKPTASMKALLAPMLEQYKLSATHLNNFIDISHGGPQGFLMNNLLRFPQAKSAGASFGTAIHAALQRAHTHLSATGERRPAEDVIGDFVRELHDQRLNIDEFNHYAKRGTDALSKFLHTEYDSFTPAQKAELNFASQGVTLGDARLTGSLDLVDINDNHIFVTDYKTGKPSTSWTGRGDYEKIKLHKYRQQLMFYQLLCQHSRDYASYEFDGAILQFVEPDSHGNIHSLDQTFSTEELTQFAALIAAVWRCIVTLELPDASDYSADYKGILQFEKDLIARTETSAQN